MPNLSSQKDSNSIVQSIIGMDTVAQTIPKSISPKMIVRNFTFDLGDFQ